MSNTLREICERIHRNAYDNGMQEAHVNAFDLAALRDALGVPQDTRPPCRNMCPPEWTGHWREWHRGHGCNRDDGRPPTGGQHAATPERMRTLQKRFDVKSAQAGERE